MLGSRFLAALLVLGACNTYNSSLLLDGGAGDVAVEGCTTMCGSTCVNLQTDTSNCGACGKTCETGCAGGYCKPTQLASGLGAPHGVLLNGSSIYVALYGTINVIFMSKVDGTGLKNFGTNSIQPDRLASDGTTLYWTSDVNINNTPGGSIWEETFAQTMCNATNFDCYFVSELPSPYGITVQGSNMFFTTQDAVNNGPSACAGLWTSSVLQCPKGGCNLTNCVGSPGPTVLAANQTKLASITADATNVYWADSGGGEVRYCPQPGCTGGPKAFAQNLQQPWDVVSDGKTVYFTDRKANTLYSCDTGGCGSSPKILAGSLDDALLIALDAKNVYVTLYSVGEIAMCPLPDCAGGPVTLETGLHGPYGIVSDGTYIYWTEEGSAGTLSTDGSVSKLKIP